MCLGRGGREEWGEEEGVEECEGKEEEGGKETKGNGKVYSIRIDKE